MRQLLSEIWSYIKLLWKEWLTIVLYTVGLLTTFLPALSTNIIIDSFYYRLVAVVCILIAPFFVVRRLQHRISELQPDTTPKPTIPKLEISFFEGHEYSFSLDKRILSRIQGIEDELNPKINEAKKEIDKIISERDNSEDDSTVEYHNDKIAIKNEYVEELLRIIKDRKDEYFERSEYFSPDTIVSINIRIKNIGEQDLEILSIGVTASNDIDFIRSVHNRSKLFDEKSNTDIATLLITIGQSINYVARGSLRLDALHPLSFAAELAQVHSGKETLKVVVYARNNEGKTMHFSQTIKVSIANIKDLYIEYWKEQNMTELLRLANAL